MSPCMGPWYRQAEAALGFRVFLESGAWPGAPSSLVRCGEKDTGAEGDISEQVAAESNRKEAGEGCSGDQEGLNL